MPAALANALSRPTLPLLIAGAALAAFALGHLGQVSAAFDLVAQFTAHWLLIASIAAAACFAPRFAYALLAVAAAAAILSPALIARLYAAPPAVAAGVGEAVASVEAGTSPTPLPAGSPLSLLVFNTYNHNRNVDALWQEILRHDADIVALIELGPNKRDLLQRLAARYPHHAACADDWNCAIGLFSRLPVAAFERVRPADDAGPSLIAAEVSWGGRPITVIGTHILSPNHGPRANFIELDQLAERIGRLRVPVIVAGDLNTTLWANAFDNFRRKSGLVHMVALIPTWPVQPLPLPQIGIDHVFTSADLRVTRVRAGAAAGSDHLPLIAKIAWR